MLCWFVSVRSCIMARYPSPSSGSTAADSKGRSRIQTLGLTTDAEAKGRYYFGAEPFNL